MFSKKFVGFIALSLFSSAAVADDCKCTPGSKCWPSANQWNKLNSTVSGRLIKTVPLGSVCYAGPHYDAAACKTLQAKWSSPVTHTEDPTSVLFSSWANDTCLPVTDPNASGCSGLGLYPNYVIDAREVEDVQAGVNFAREKNIRLVVKNTGHDFLGRSTGPNSLSIWTHHLKEMKIHDSFVPAGCKAEGHPAVTIGSGSQLKEIYEALNEKGLIVVAGADFSVGIGGYILGGGHGPMSAKYGLAIDSALEMTVVTPDGKLVVANQCQNSDIFWALRGGGGGTFGVLISATLKTYPTPKVSFALYTANLTTKNTERFWDAVADVFTDIPRMMDDGLMGYLYVFNYGSSYSFTLMASMVDQSPEELGTTIAPLAEKMNTTYASDFGATGFKVPPVQFPTYFGYWGKVLGAEQPVRTYALLPSRLIPKESLAKNKKEFIKQTLPKAGAKGHTVLAVGLVAGKGVAQHSGNDVAANPAWRKAYLHMFSSIVFPNEEPGRSQAFDHATNEYEKALINLAPDSGAYLNEANPYTKDPALTFWGKSNYARLSKIKKQLDPKGVFYCRACVGSEGYVEKNGAICKKGAEKRDTLFTRWFR